MRNDVHIRDDTVVTSDSCNSGHIGNYEKILTSSCKCLKFSTKWHTKLCNLVDNGSEKLHCKVTFSILKKKPNEGT